MTKASLFASTSRQAYKLVPALWQFVDGKPEPIPLGIWVQLGAENFRVQLELGE